MTSANQTPFRLAGTTAAHRLVEALVAHGTTHVFCVPGESYLAVLDALADAPIRVIACRHEAGAANMAEAHGKLTGRPGICMVTRGPGATHASIGVHTAHQDSTPMILFVGQVARGQKGRGAFQELDYAQVFGGLAKWAAEIDDGDRVGEFVGRAFATATQGRRGPVVLALPEDMLRDEVPCQPTGTVRSTVRAGLDPEALERIGARLAAAERPLLVLGGTGWTATSLSALGHWAEKLSLSFALSFRRKDLIDNRHRCYAGDLGLGVNPKLVARVREADLIVSLGCRLGENTTQGYTLLTAEQTAAKLVHIMPGPEEIGRVWPAAIGAVADMTPAALALATLDPGRRWDDWCAGARAECEAFGAPVAVTGDVNLGEVYTHLREALPEDAIVTNGAGNFAAWLHRYFPHYRWNTQLAPTSGAMGYGLPAAVAAKIVHPTREVVCAAGDGDFLMLGQELATAVQYGANIVVLVVDNGSYGTIRMHQERDYPGRTVATDLRNPDFVAYARSFGAWGALVRTTAEFPAALAAARVAGVPALIHIVTSVEDISPGRSLHAK